MKRIKLIVFMLLASYSCTTKKSKTNITIFFEGIKKDTIFIGSWAPLSNSEKIDTVYISDGKLKYFLSINELNKIAIVPKSSALSNKKLITSSANIINLWMNKKDKMYINAKVHKNIIDYSVYGNNFSEQHSEARKKFLKLLEKSHQLRIKKSTYPINQRNDSIKKLINEESKKLFFKRIELAISFVEKNKNYEYSAWLLFNVINTNNKEKVIELFNELSSEVKASFWGIKLSKMVNGFKAFRTGYLFPEINTKTVTGKTINLKNYRGKYLLIDFWGSWCGPCIDEIPKLKEYYKNYNSKLEILGIACNDNKNKLSELISKMNIKWDNILSSNLKNDTNNFVDKFQIRVYPTKVLLDKNGHVIKTYIGSDKELFKDMDNLFK
ncbi:MAG: TlpA family protein disulfide reductase [Flavobacteriaceae bacterium]|nr:TlpA family protein disulfide reductase [Flavobacteriaceae bacterium]